MQVGYWVRVFFVTSLNWDESLFVRRSWRDTRPSSPQLITDVESRPTDSTDFVWVDIVDVGVCGVRGSSNKILRLNPPIAVNVFVVEIESNAVLDLERLG